MCNHHQHPSPNRNSASSISKLKLGQIIPVAPPPSSLWRPPFCLCEPMAQGPLGCGLTGCLSVCLLGQALGNTSDKRFSQVMLCAPDANPQEACPPLPSAALCPPLPLPSCPASHPPGPLHADSFVSSGFRLLCHPPVDASCVPQPLPHSHSLCFISSRRSRQPDMTMFGS